MRIQQCKEKVFLTKEEIETIKNTRLLCDNICNNTEDADIYYLADSAFDSLCKLLKIIAEDN